MAEIHCQLAHKRDPQDRIRFTFADVSIQSNRNCCMRISRLTYVLARGRRSPFDLGEACRASRGLANLPQGDMGSINLHLLLDDVQNAHAVGAFENYAPRSSHQPRIRSPNVPLPHRVKLSTDISPHCHRASVRRIPPCSATDTCFHDSSRSWWLMWSCIQHICFCESMAMNPVPS